MTISTSSASICSMRRAAKRKMLFVINEFSNRGVIGAKVSTRPPVRQAGTCL